jgi:hypothetical protein
VKVALYLQDHLDGSGLTVRVSSHRTPALDHGAALSLPLHAGDVVLFDVRLTHRGVPGAPLDYVIAGAARALPATRRGATVDGVRRWVMRRRGGRDRVAVYFAYGVPGTMTASFAARNMARQRGQIGRSAPLLAQTLADALTGAGVSIADV